jgi:rhodanese-related sulfurtransferase
MFGFMKRKPHKEITPGELDGMLRQGQVLLIDVREPGEFRSGHIAGAVNLPLSRFAIADIPEAVGRQIVLQCAGGRRSGMALGKCAAAGAAIDTHLGGGIAAWSAAGLPLVRG